jgi:hypothetical protein
MGYMLTSLTERITEAGFAEIELQNQNEERVMFSAKDYDGNVVYVKVVIDDEVTYDEWEIFYQWDGTYDWHCI